MLQESHVITPFEVRISITCAQPTAPREMFLRDDHQITILYPGCFFMPNGFLSQMLSMLCDHRGNIHNAKMHFCPCEHSLTLP
jgi:hypothetical protein